VDMGGVRLVSITQRVTTKVTKVRIARRATERTTPFQRRWGLGILCVIDPDPSRWWPGGLDVTPAWSRNDQPLTWPGEFRHNGQCGRSLRPPVTPPPSTQAS